MIVEIRDLEGHLRERRRVGALFSVGRAYSNDIILDDPYVCPAHLRVEPRDGMLGGAVDVGSVNGVYSWPDEVKLPQFDIRSNSRIRIGDTVLVFIDEQESVGPTIMRARGVVRRERREHPFLTFLASCLFLLTSGIYTFTTTHLTDDGGGIAHTLIVYTVVLGAMTLLWSALWSVVTKLLRHRFFFWAHLNIAVFFMFASYPVTFAQDWLQFVTNGSLVSTAFAGLAYCGWFTGLMFYHLRRVSRTRGPWALMKRAAVLPVLSLIVLASVRFYQRDTFSTELPIISETQPQRLLTRSGVSVDKYFEKVGRLEARLKEDLTK